MDRFIKKSSSYTGIMSQLKVSICCLAYNHEKYIEKALEGFLNQKTNFEFEIIVHEDASTDNTAAIIKKFEKRYPQIIKPIYQKENQFSKDVGILDTFLYPKSNGKYIALCEGDDYWVDEFKLQKQVDYMEKNPKCTFCFTNGYIENLLTGERRKFIPYSKQDEEYYIKGSKKYTLADIYKISFAPTASYMFRKEDWNKMPSKYFERVPAGDLKTRLYFTALGYAYFIDQETCVYRENVPNSAMSQWKKQSRKQVYDRSKKIVDMINNVDSFTRFQYTENLNMIKDIHIRGMLNNASNFSVFKNEGNIKVFKNCNIIDKIKIILKITLSNYLMYRR